MEQNILKMASARIHFPFHKNPICKGAHSDDAIAGSNLFSFFSVLFNNTSQFPEKLLEQICYRETILPFLFRMQANPRNGHYMRRVSEFFEET